MNIPAHPNSFGARDTLTVGARSYTYFRLDALASKGYDLATLPFSFKVLLENLLRFEDGRSVTAADVAALAGWKPGSTDDKEIAYRPARVLLQDFTGVPCVVDLAAMRDAIAEMGGQPKKINPLQPVEIVVDHSVQVAAFGTADVHCIGVRSPSRPFSFGQPVMPIGSRTSSLRVGSVVRMPISSP